MAKFSGSDTSVRKATSVLSANFSAPDVATKEGAPAFSLEARAELFTLAVTNMVSENTFYEEGSKRDSRFGKLVEELAVHDPEFIAQLIPFLRNTANMRSASIVAAAHYAHAGGPNRRAVVASAMSRADEPAEFIGYWFAQWGKTISSGTKRGIADAVNRLYNQYSAMKYDGNSRGIRMGDVIEIVHPKPKDAEQSDLFQYLLDRRHNPTEVRVDTRPNLNRITMRNTLQAMPEDDRRAFVKSDGAKLILEEAGTTWEWMSGWITGGMDKTAWEAAIPSMGYMALLRNLRNFDEADISQETFEFVSRKLADPDEVARSRQFPYRFWSAWSNTDSVRWGAALAKALELSTQNIPVLPGSTLVLVDVSGSMSYTVSGKSSVSLSEIAALFGAAVQSRNDDVKVAVFGTNSKDVTRKGDIITRMDTYRGNHGVGHGTSLHSALESQYKDEDRVIILSDMQTMDYERKEVSKTIPFIHSFDLAGYGNAPFKMGGDGRYLYAGFTDAAFRQVALLERTKSQDWDAILSPL